MAGFFIDEFTGSAGTLIGHEPDAGGALSDWTQSYAVFTLTGDGFLSSSGYASDFAQFFDAGPIGVHGYRVDFAIKRSSDFFYASGYDGRLAVYAEYGVGMALYANGSGSTLRLTMELTGPPSGYVVGTVDIDANSDGSDNPIWSPSDAIVSGYIEVTPTSITGRFIDTVLEVPITWAPPPEGYNIHVGMRHAFMDRLEVTELSLSEDVLDRLVLRDTSSMELTESTLDRLVVRDLTSADATTASIDRLVLRDMLPPVERTVEMLDRLALRDAASGTAVMGQGTLDRLVLRDASGVNVVASNLDRLALRDASAVTVVVGALDRLVLRDIDASTAAKIASILDRLALRDMASPVIVADALDRLVLRDTSTPNVVAAVDVLDQLVLRDAVQLSAVLHADVLDRLVLRDGSTVHGIYNGSVLDRLVLRDMSAQDAALMAAWVMNSQGAMSRYTGLPFESVAAIGDRVLALGADGFFLLAGDQDDGAEIQALARTGRLLMGKDSVKYLGDVLLHFVSESPMEVGITSYGRRNAGTYTYTTEPRPTNEPVAARVKPGKGLSSVYFQWTVANTGGARLSVKSAAAQVAPSTNRKAY